MAASIVAGVVIYWLTTGIDGGDSSTGGGDGAASPVPLQVTIGSPAEGSTVATHQQVSGVVSDWRAQVWVVVHPLETADCWVQSQAVVEQGGAWSASAQFGEAVPEHSGKPYEIRALANPRSRLSPGMVRCWPAAGASSKPLRVRRR